MAKAKTTAQPLRVKATESSQTVGAQRRRPAYDQSLRVGKGYVPVRSYQIPADRHE